MFTSVGLPHGFCFLWDPPLLWLHVLSDSLIALAYFLIPLVLVHIVRKRRDVPFNSIFFCFAAFIVACGITHVMEVVTLWHPIYWVSGTVKALTAAISLATFVLLMRLTPAILAIPHQKELQYANHRLNSVLESTVAGVIATDGDWRINYVNGRTKSVLKVDDSILGANLFDAFPQSNPGSRERLQQVMETRQPANYDSYYPPLDLFTAVQVHPWEHGGITIFFTDISDQRRLQRELDKERARRDQHIEALAHMAGGLAHEISNPLGIIHARASDLAELALEVPTLPSAEVTAACTSIVKTSDRAMRILRGLRMFAREASRDPMQPAQIAALIEQTVDLVRIRYEAHGIAIQTAVPPNLPLLECREVQISQIVLNLLNNAFDAIDSAPAGERWTRVEATALQLSKSAPDRIQIDVIDSGPGVPEEHRTQIMDAFFTTKPIGAGMGVGLSLCKAIAEDHGGTLDLAQSGGHTCFRLVLPLKQSSTMELPHEDR